MSKLTLNAPERGSLKSLIIKSGRSPGLLALRLDCSRTGLLDSSRVSLRELRSRSLRTLLDILPSGKLAKLTSPILKSVRHKVKKAQFYTRRPQFDPESWPKIFRLSTKLNGDRGLKMGPNGIVYQLNSKGISTSLNVEFSWTESRGGALIIMGDRSQIMRVITESANFKASSASIDAYGNNVDMQFDRMYGDLSKEEDDRLNKMNLFVSLMPGNVFTPTTSPGTVVLDARTEVVKLVASNIAGLAGAGIQIPNTPVGQVFQRIQDVKDNVEFVDGMVENLSGKNVREHVVDLHNKVKDSRDERPAMDKTKLTLFVDLVPQGKFAVNTGEQELSNEDLEEHFKKLVNKMYA